MRVSSVNGLSAALGILGCALTIGACGRATPAAPDTVSAATTAPGVADRAVKPAPLALTTSVKDGPAPSASFGEGSFTVTTVGGDQLVGTYNGEAFVLNGQTSVSLHLTVTDGSGRFAGAAGTLSGDGSGEFAGEGSFTLSVRGKVTTTELNNFPVRIALQGTSSASCASGHIVIDQAATGEMTREGNVSATLHHEVLTGGACGGG